MRHTHPLLPAYSVIAVCLAFVLPSLIALGADERQLLGVSVWAKPLKFEASIALHFATVAVLAGLLSREAAGSRLLRLSMLAAGLAAILEILYIVLQAARGRASHFNFETPLDEVLYGLMGLGAVTIVVGSFILGVLVWRSARPDAGSGLRTGAALGLMTGSLATLFYAGVLSSWGGHAVGGSGSDADGLPLVGWSASGGDLRVAHFLATHTMQAIPVLGLFADRIAPRVAGPLTLAAAVLYQLLPAAAFMQALAGRPLIAL